MPLKPDTSPIYTDGHTVENRLRTGDTEGIGYIGRWVHEYES